MGDFPFGFGKPSGGGDDPDRNDSDDSSDASGGSGSSRGIGFGGPGSGSGGPGGPGGSGPGGPVGPGGFDPFGDPNNPFGALFGQMNPADLGAAFQQLGKLLSYEGGPVNWDLAKDIARQTIAQRGDASVGRVERTEVEESMRLAELWLDEATPLPSGASTVLAWSRAEWIEATLPQWRDLVEP
ncbi:MAG: hydrolase, partial [Streptomycetaceae bacterium]|nr:hydrolase [Streptomycetaceae bacterium]